MVKAFFVCSLSFFLLSGVVGCSSLNRAGEYVKEAVSPTNVRLIRHHLDANVRSLEEFILRLYARNPKFEPDLLLRQRKINQIFHGGFVSDADWWHKSSKELLTAAFAPESSADRVYLLGLGMVKSIREAYMVIESGMFVSGLQIPLEQLQRLHSNLSQVNWRLKTYRDDKGNLLFLTNGMGENGYLNMGYEVIMTRILTRIEDDIYLHGGLPEKYLFDMSTLFLSILI